MLSMIHDFVHQIPERVDDGGNDLRMRQLYHFGDDIWQIFDKKAQSNTGLDTRSGMAVNSGRL